MSILQMVSEDMSRTWPSILITCIVALVFSWVVLILFRYAIKYVIWIIYIGLVILLIVGSIALLMLYSEMKESANRQDVEAANFVILGSIVLAVFALILALLLCFFRRRIHLVIQIFKEASKALIDVPLIITEPVLTFIALGFTCAGFVYFAMLIESSGTLTIHTTEDGEFDKATYEKNLVMKISHYLNLVAFLWFTSFILGCQHFIIGSTVCQWFFTRSKDKLDSPIQRGFSHLFRFHIGSVCLGSILITLVKIIRMIVESVQVRKFEIFKHTKI